MDKHSKKRNILIALIVLTLCFIWGNSMMPASVSGVASERVKDIINAILGGWGNFSMPSEGLLRKIAHAAEFALLGIELKLLMEQGRKIKVSLLALCGLGAALIDETIQLFVDGRSGQIKDIWIDLAGFVIGVAIAGLIRHLIYCRNTRKLRHTNYQKH